MASIIKRKNKFCVVYRYVDEHGSERQKWETFSSNADAKARKKEIEYKQSTNTFIAPSCKTVKDLLHDYVTIYGINKWAMSTYNSRTALLDNYVLPVIGEELLENCTPRMMEKYYRSLMAMPSAPRSNQKTTDCITAKTVHQVHKILRSAFNQAVKWELLLRNPVEKATLPSVEKPKRDIWTAETLMKALSHCEDDRLALSIHLAFACSLRMGELLGLTWDCVDISEESVKAGNASIFIDKELQRVYQDAYDALDGKDVKLVFPSFRPKGSTVLVLKTPKTESSVRRVYLPKSVAEMLIECKKNQEGVKEIFGSDYYNYNLVICSTDGRPVEGQLINRGLCQLIRDHDLPKVVFHSFRHTSITYKLKLNGGDMKSVQGDSGHSQMKMVSDVYSHIIDEDRVKNAQSLETAFYSSNSTDAKMDKETSLEEKSKELIEMLNQTPELASILLQNILNKQLC